MKRWAKGWWTSAMGNDICIKHMSEGHLINVVAMLWKEAAYRQFDGPPPTAEMNERCRKYKAKAQELLDELNRRR